jgi:UDPglucose 6-dehydrogenase
MRIRELNEESSPFMNDAISVIGLGKLGVCLAACAASKGMRVTGVDLSPRTVTSVNEGRPPVVEPGLAEMMGASRERLRATHDMQLAIAESSISFIVVPTPSEPSGAFSLRYVLAAVEEIGKSLRNKSDYHLVVIVSTVLPGSTQFGILPILERSSGKSCGVELGLCYGPEFIALGDVIRGMLRPDFVLIGESDPRAGSTLEAWYKNFCDNRPPICRMNWVNAELTKIAVNTYVTTKISFANMLSAICERLPGADVDTVTGALGRDSRIGRRYLTGGLGYGGPCFPRDNQALAFMAKTLGCRATVAEATDAQNKSWCASIVNRITSLVPRDKRIAILGLSYKPGTNVIEESQPLAIARALVAQGYKLIVFDSCALDNVRLVLRDNVSYASSVTECLDLAEAVVIASDGEELKKLRGIDFPQREEQVIVFDCWRVLQNELPQVDWVKYVPLGVGENERAVSARLADVWQAPAVG